VPRGSDQGGIDRSFLGEAAIRLARLFGISGAISPDFLRGEKILPVVTVGDGLDVGMGGNRGRRWMAGAPSGGVGSFPWIRLDAAATQPLIVDHVVCASDTTESAFFRLAFTAAAGSQATQSFTERLTGAVQVVPGLFTGSGGALGASTVVGHFRVGNNSQPTIIPLRLYMAPGQAFQIQVGAAGQIQTWWHGRTF
jgi:hypothetical protein